MMKDLVKKFICIFLCLQVVNTAKILGIFPMASRSHYSLGNALMRGLAEAGHDVTMISPREDTVPTKNGSYRNIILTGFVEAQEAAMKRINWFEHIYINSFTHFLNFQDVAVILIEKTFAHQNVQKLLKTTETFDVVIVEQIFSEAFKVFAYHFKAHLVVFSSIAAESKINYVVGNPTMLSYTPQVDTDFSKEMTLYQRIHNTLLYVSEVILMQFRWLPIQNKLVQKYFPGYPPIYDINYNVSLILVNSHESIQPAIPLVPNIIPIGGFHIKRPKALPEDLQNYIDKASEGVIYVSFGSSLKAVHLPKNKKEVLLQTFRELKQKVLWKWEDEYIQDLPSNVKTSKWLPQIDVLAHPNVKLFVTQVGLLSLTEAIYNKVPVLGIPVFGDQATNAQNVVIDGYGLTIPFHDKNFTKIRLRSTIEELITNPKYMENAKKRSQYYHDRQVHPLQKAIYWIEYIIRHDGAPHLRVAGMKLPWYQHYLLDVILIFFTVFISFVIIIWCVIQYLLKLCKKKNVDKSKKKKKKN